MGSHQKAAKKHAEKARKHAEKDARLRAKDARKSFQSLGKEIRTDERVEKAEAYAKDFGQKLQEGTHKANEWVQREVAPKVQEQIDKAAPAVENAVSKARVQAGVAAGALATKLDSADVSNPKVEQLAGKLTGDKKAVKKYQKQAAKSAKQFAKEQKKAGRKSHKGLLALGLLVAAGSAAVAVWRASRPVEDPWKTPADPKHVPAAKPVGQPDAAAAQANAEAGVAGRDELSGQQVAKSADAPKPANLEHTEQANPKDVGAAAPGAPMNKPAHAKKDEKDN